MKDELRAAMVNAVKAFDAQDRAEKQLEKAKDATNAALTDAANLLVAASQGE